MFLRNAWYAAETSARLAAQPMAVTLLGEPVVLFRKQDGSVAALEDACPHRKLPLSRGKLRGDHLECGYHGLTFDGAGTCVRAPGNPEVPSGARVHSYPCIERYGLIWVWTGEPSLADSSRLIEIAHWGEPGYGCTDPDSMTMACNYLFITDNLLDPSHVAWVHPTSFGDESCKQTPLSTVALDNGMVVSRWLLNTPVAPFYQRFVKFTGNADRKQHYEVRFPSLALTRAIFTPAGTGGDEGALHPDAFEMDSYGFITPIDESSSRYFFLQMRNFAAGDAEVSAQFGSAVRAAFDEDRVILEAVQVGMQSKRTPNIDLKIDAGPTRFRRRLKQLIQAEERLAAISPARA